MRILVVDPHRIERETTLRLIPADLHEIKVAVDAAEALRLLEEETFEVVLVESTMTGTTGNELVKRIRAAEANSHVYIVVTASRGFAGDVKNAFAVGADDFIRKPICKDELLARIEGPVRIRRWAQRLYNGATVVDFHPPQRPRELTELKTWTSMDATICAELSEMLGARFEPAVAEAPLDGAVFASALGLTVAADQCDVRIAVGLDRPTSAALSEALFGASDIEPSAMTDMVSEIVNVAGGAIKRLAASEGRALTTHVPRAVDAVLFRRPDAVARRHWLAVSPSMTLRFEVELRSREPRLVRVSSLREGMVVTADLHNPKGALLMRSGTRITEAHLAGLASTLGEDLCIEVLEAA